MSNQALPARSRRLLEQHAAACQNLGLLLDKYAPWGLDHQGNWDLVMKESIRRKGKTSIQTTSGGQAKGLWLSTSRKATSGETPSLFEERRTDVTLMKRKQERWREMVVGADGIAFTLRLTERMAAGLGASHVLETGLTLDRNTGLPYLPGSTVKGLARAWGLIEVAAQLDIALTDETAGVLNQLAKILISQPPETLDTEINKLLAGLPQKANPDEAAGTYVDYFRFIFGSQSQAGAVGFTDAIYYGSEEPRYVTDVMTPHFVDYYTGNGQRAPSDDSEPNPVSFLTVDKGNVFAFALLPRPGAFSEVSVSTKDTLLIAHDWLIRALTRLGAGSKTAAGYGYFNRKSKKMLLGE